MHQYVQEVPVRSQSDRTKPVSGMYARWQAPVPGTPSSSWDGVQQSPKSATLHKPLNNSALGDSVQTPEGQTIHRKHF